MEKNKMETKKCVECGKEITENDRAVYCSEVICGSCKTEHEEAD